MDVSGGSPMDGMTRSLRPSTAPVGENNTRSWSRTLARGDTVVIDGDGVHMPPGMSGQRFTRYYFPLAEVPNSPTFFGREAQRPGTARVTGSPKMFSPEVGEGAQARLPFYGHYDVVTAWDFDDPALDTTAYSPNLGYDRMQMAYVPFGHAKPSERITNLYHRPSTARRGAEGTTLQRVPEPALPEDDFTREAVMWRKYTTRHAGQHVDIQELVAWAVQLHPRSVQDLKPLFILLQGLLKDMMHDKLLFYSSEILELRQMLSDVQKQAEADLQDAQGLISELYTKLGDAEQKAKVKARFSSAIGKLGDLARRAETDKHSEHMQEVMDARAAREAAAEQREKDLSDEVARLKKLVENQRVENAGLSESIVELNATVKVLKEERSDVRRDLQSAQDKIALLGATAAVQHGVTTKWGQASLHNSAEADGTPSPCDALADILVARKTDAEKMGWLREAGANVGSAALTSLTRSSDTINVASTLIERMEKHEMSRYLSAMPATAAGEALKVVLLKANADKNQKLIDRVIGALDSMEPERAACVLSYTPSPITRRFVDKFKYKERVEAGMAAWTEGKAALASASQALSSASITDLDSVSSAAKETRASLVEAAGKLEKISAGSLVHLLGTASGNLGESMVAMMSIEKRERVRETMLSEVLRRTALTKAVANFGGRDGGWKLGERSRAAVAALASADGFEETIQRTQDLLLRIKDEHGLALTIVTDLGAQAASVGATAADDGNSEDQVSDVPSGMVVLGSTETGEGLDEEEMGKAGLGLFEVELGRRNSGGLQKALGAAMESREAVWTEGHAVQPLVIHSASADGKLSSTPDKAWGAITTSTGALAAGLVGGSSDWVCSICGRKRGEGGHKHGGGGVASAMPLEAVLGMVAAATAAAAEKLEREEVELMALADDAEKEMERVVGGALPSMKSLSNEKAKRVLKMLAGRVVKRLRHAKLQQQLRELKSYNNPPIKVVCIVTSLFVFLDAPGVAPYLQRGLKLNKEADTSQLWKYLRSRLDVRQVLKDMSNFSLAAEVLKERATAVSDILADCSHGEAVTASKAVGEMRKWCIARANYALAPGQ